MPQDSEFLWNRLNTWEQAEQGGIRDMLRGPWDGRRSGVAQIPITIGTVSQAASRLPAYVAPGSDERHGSIRGATDGQSAKRQTRVSALRNRGERLSSISQSEGFGVVRWARGDGSKLGLGFNINARGCLGGVLEP